MAVHPVAGLALAAERVVVVGQVVDDEQVEVAVVVGVEEARAGAPFLGAARDAGSCRDVREGAVPVVAEQGVGAQRRHIQIEVAVVVEIADGDAGLVARAIGVRRRRARARGDVGERPVTVVVVQHVRGPRRAVHEVHVRVAVVVVVDPRDAGAEGLEHALFRRRGGVMDERDARRGRDIGEGGRTGRRRPRRLSRLAAANDYVEACRDDERQRQHQQAAHHAAPAPRPVFCRSSARSASFSGAPAFSARAAWSAAFT